MNTFLQQLYYGNTVGQWTVALVIIVASVVVGRVVYALISRGVKRLTHRTVTLLDDMVVGMLEEPAVALMVLVGVRYALGTLNMSTGAAAFVNGAFNLVVTLLFGWLIMRLYEGIHKQYLVPLAGHTESQLDDQVLAIILSGVRFIVTILAIVIGLNNAGYDVGTVLAGLGIGGLAFALAAQDTVANIFGGVTMLIQRPFTPGDRIRVADTEGYIRRFGLRSAQLETTRGEKIMVPNSIFISNPIFNLDVCRFYSQEETYPLHRDTTPETIERLLVALRAMAEANPHVLWADGLLNKIGKKSFEVTLSYGVAPWEPGGEFSSHFHKIDTVRHYVNMNALKLFRELGVELAGRSNQSRESSSLTVARPAAAVREDLAGPDAQ